MADAAPLGPQPEDLLLPGRGHREGGRRRQLRRLRGQDARHRRRERLRQERHRALDPADRRAAGPHRRAARSCSQPDGERHGRSADGRPGQARRRTAREMRAIRGGEIGLIFQEPMTSFSPVHTVGNQIIEAIRLHQTLEQAGGARAGDRAAAAWSACRGRSGGSTSTPSAERRPAPAGDDRDGAVLQSRRLLIADEPTTALDVTTQAQILDLLRELQQRRRAWRSCSSPTTWA